MSQNERLWYKDAVIYEVHVRSFYDSDGDGIGDLRGLTEKLDYIEELGVTALWILPFYPSPLKDDGYDIASYTEIHPSYGTLNDFEELLREAHRRGLKVITELVLNHTSDQHVWFQRARRAPRGSVERDFYVWSDDPTKYKEARIIFADTKSSNWTWDPVAGQYYWHRFYAHQPDLNFDNPAVQEAVLEVVDFWLSMGIDGMRLDAITYLYEREGTNCESLPETHAFLKKLRRHIDERYPNRMLLAEANQWPEEAVDYFGDSDECHMAFHFPLMPRLFMAVQMEDRFPIIDILEQTPEIAYDCQWAIFLRNHDELTLEMVTDEERDLMYRAYAPELRMRINLGIRRRLAPLLRNDVRKIKLLYSLLFALNGTPIIYYGDELGMGDNYHLGDRDGVRTPMQWSPDLNAGFSRANPQSLFLPVITDPEYHYLAINVQTQEDNPTSLLQWVKRLVSIRKRHPAFARGSLEFVPTNNHRVLAFVRSAGTDHVLVVINLSRAVQHVVLDLSRHVGQWPVELWGRSEFPRIDTDEYELSLGPYNGYWFGLEREQPTSEPSVPEPHRLPVLEVKQDWMTIFEGRHRAHFSDHLRAYIKQQSWYHARARRIESIDVSERIRVRFEDEQAAVCLVQVSFLNGDNETFVMPLACACGRDEQEIRQQSPESIVAPVFIEATETTGVVYDALAHPDFCKSVLGMIRRCWDLQGQSGTLHGEWMQTASEISPADIDLLEPMPVEHDDRHSTVVFGNSMVLKVMRRLERGESLDVEVGRHLMQLGFEHVAPFLGFVDYRRGRWEPVSVASLHHYVPHRLDGWQWAHASLESTFARIDELGDAARADGSDTQALLELGAAPLPDPVHRVLGEFLEQARLLGRRAGELHIALATPGKDVDFEPEPFLPTYERSRYQSMRTLAVRALRLLKHRQRRLPEAARTMVELVLDSQDDMITRFRSLVGRNIGGTRTRIHGDLHLHDLLVTHDHDFVIIDLEGHPWLPIGERRIKRSPLWDVASMIRSFHNVSRTALKARSGEGEVLLEDEAPDERFVRLSHFWYVQTSAVFLNGYVEATDGKPFIPANRDAFAVFLDALLLERALHQLERELQRDASRVDIPLCGVLMLLGHDPM